MGSLENPFFTTEGGGGHKKTIYMGELPKEGGLDSLQIKGNEVNALYVDY